MRKILILVSLATFTACNSGSDSAKVETTAATDSSKTDNLTYPYTANYSSKFEIGDPNPEKPAWRTGSIYPFKASSKANTRTVNQWNEFEMACIGHDYSVRINGQLVTTWTDSEQRSSTGHIGLQNYNDGKTVRFRNLRVKDLP